jgi:hypothetical protein
MSLILGVSLSSCLAEPPSPELDEDIESADESASEAVSPLIESEAAPEVAPDEADQTDSLIPNCQGDTPYVCYRNGRAWCQPGGHLCGPGHCDCPCEWYCCDSPEDTCT